MRNIYKIKVVFIFFILFQFWRLDAQLCFSLTGTYAASTGAYSVKSADFNSDGKLDLAIANYNSNTISLLLGNGLGSFGAATNFTVGPNPRNLTCADFNSDGKMDIVSSNQTSNDVSLLLGNGSGSFAAASYFTVGLNPYSVAHSDFNGDGKLDLVTANNLSSDVSMLLGNGSGSFGPANSFSIGCYPDNITCADFNGDSNIDIVTANSANSNISIMLGNGSGSFGAATSYMVNSGPFYVISLDVDVSGEMDLVTSNFYTGNIAVLKGNGIGGFYAPIYYTTGANPRGLTCADYDGDGKVDIATANFGSMDVSILLGNGTGNFSAPISFTVSTSPEGIVSGDFDNNGKIDIATANQNLDNSSVLLNKAPPVTANSTATVVCIGNSITFTGGGANTYTWTNGITNGVPFTPTTSATFYVTGTNTVTGCSYSAGKYILVNPLPTVNAVSTNSFTCAGQTVTILISGSATSYSLNSVNTSTAAVVIPFVTTTYTVMGTDANGCSNTAIITQSVSTCTGIQQLENISSELKIFPNPTSGECNVHLNIVSEKVSIEIYNSLGQLIYKEKPITLNTVIDLSEMANGVYQLRISESNGTIWNEKIIKQ